MPSFFFFLRIRPPPRSTLFPYTTLSRSAVPVAAGVRESAHESLDVEHLADPAGRDEVAHHAEVPVPPPVLVHRQARSEEHTSELQSRQYLVCRLLLEKKKIRTHIVRQAT